MTPTLKEIQTILTTRVVTNREANQIVQALVTEAQRIGPKDGLTRFAYLLATILRGILVLPQLLFIPVATFVLSIAIRLTFGLLLIPLSLIWLPFYGLLWATSWLWLKVPILRPLLLLPGVALSIIADIYVALIPNMGEHYQKVLKMGLADSWPFSYLLWQLNQQMAREE